MSIQNVLGEKEQKEVMEIVRASFRPESLNRLDEIIIFHRLAKDHISHIVDIQLARLQKTLTSRRITLSFSEDAKNLLADKGYDPSCLWSTTS